MLLAEKYRPQSWADVVGRVRDQQRAEALVPDCLVPRACEHPLHPVVRLAPVVEQLRGKQVPVEAVPTLQGKLEEAQPALAQARRCRRGGVWVA